MTTDLAAHENGFVGLDPYDAIRAERAYQDRKWGGPEHDSHHSFQEWALILGREYGEALSAIGGILWPSDRAPNTSAWDRHMDLRAELIQVAAVAVSIIEQMDPSPTPPPTPAPDDDGLIGFGKPKRTLRAPTGTPVEVPAPDEAAKWMAVSNEWDRQRSDYRSSVLSDYDSNAPLFNRDTERLACLQAVRDEMIRQGLAAPADRVVCEVRPTIVCLCGSGRFRDAFEEAEFSETLAGKIVLTIGCNTKDIARDVDWSHVKPMLDDLHLRKIDLADEVFIIDVGGYIGESTARELAYAKSLGKPIRYWSAGADTQGEGN